MLLLLAATAFALPVTRPGWFLCDGIDRPVAWLVGTPDAAGGAALTRLNKRDGRTTTRRIRVGRADPAAGSVYYALSVGGREVGSVRRLNPGMAPDPTAVTTLPFTSVTLDGETTQCRWLADTVLAGLTRRRGIVIARVGGSLVYRSFDFAGHRPVVHPDGVQRSNRPSLEIAGGTERVSSDGRRDWRFVRDGWLYIVSTRSDGGDASLTLLRHGRIVQAERLIGATIGERPSRPHG